MLLFYFLDGNSSDVLENGTPYILVKKIILLLLMHRLQDGGPANVLQVWFTISRLVNMNFVVILGFGQETTCHHINRNYSFVQICVWNYPSWPNSVVMWFVVYGFKLEPSDFVIFV